MSDLKMASPQDQKLSTVCCSKDKSCTSKEPNYSIAGIAITLVLYFHSPVARENTVAHSCNIRPYCLFTHQIIYMYTSEGSGCQNLRKYSATYYESHPVTGSQKMDGHNTGRYFQTGIQSAFVNSREVSQCKLAQPWFISTIAGWS